MSGRTATGLILMVIGIAVGLWGTRFANIGSPTAIGSGVVMAIIGLLLASQTNSSGRVSQHGLTAKSIRLTEFAAAISGFVTGSPGMAESENDKLLGAIVGLMDQGQKIEAIKVLREATGGGLKECKDLVDELDRALKRRRSGGA